MVKLSRSVKVYVIVVIVMGVSVLLQCFELLVGQEKWLITYSELLAG